MHIKRIMRPCAHPGCPNLVRPPAKYCADHQADATVYARRHDKERGSANDRGYGVRWAKYRKSYLSQHPLCVMCLAEGRVTPATDVDHIKPVSGPDDPLFWDPTNHQALCHSHHSRKTATENGGYGNSPKSTRT